MNKISLAGITAGLLSFMPSGSFRPNYHERRVRIDNYSFKGKPFTKGKRSKSLKERSNRSKAKRRTRA